MSEHFLAHYGVPRRSGRYPYGSGDNPYQHPYQPRTDRVEKILNGDLKTIYTEYKNLKANGYSEQDICNEWDVPSTWLRTRISAAKESEMTERNAQIMDLKEHGYSNVEIGKKLGINESVVRSSIKQVEAGKVGAAKNTADYIQSQVDKYGPIDVGIGTEHDIGVTRTKMEVAIEMLVDRGYEKHNIKIEQATNPGKFTTVEVLCPPGTTWASVYNNLDTIHSMSAYSSDNGDTYKDVLYPKAISSKRVGIRGEEDGGKDKDGLIEIRRGIDDISLGNSKYSQCRILVDGTHYIKGVAVYSDDLPDGVDILVNSKKSSSLPKLDHLKEVKDDPDNPFGALIKANGQTHYINKDGKDDISVVNKVREESDWEDYSKNLSAQFLSKQPLPLIKEQLNLAKLQKEDEYNDIKNLTNPIIKQNQLYSFADDCDAAAVTLKAAQFPRQSTKVLIPIPTLKDNQCYAPSLKEGEQVALVRYPHGGTFEIPILTVTKSNKEGKKVLGNDSLDAIGINQKTAMKLSGADFDGDTVVVIPLSDKVKIKSSVLKDIEGFDPSEAYPYREGCKIISKDKTKQSQMGSVSNLITDMTLKGATPEELARAVKHSMVVIDAQKHKLDYIRSEEENGIKALKAKYQGGANRGASTIISRASSEERVNERKYSKIDPETGKKTWVESGRTYLKIKKDPEGNVISVSEPKEYKTKVAKMANVDDAYILTSGGSKENPGTKQEALYAEYANYMKSLANKARKEAIDIKPPKVDQKNKEKYLLEVKSLEDKLDKALQNAPKERAAQLYSAATVQKKKKQYKAKGEEFTKEMKTKEGQRALTSGRIAYGAKMSGEKGSSIRITDKEWEAIQANAISANKLRQIIRYSDSDTLKKLATPHETKRISSAKTATIKAMLNRGFTLDEIADQTGVSVSTISSISKENR